MSHPFLRSFTLGRGDALVDYALSTNNIPLSMADMVGINASLINRGVYPGHAKEVFGSMFPDVEVERVMRTFAVFNGGGEDDLWSSGPAVDDIIFLNAKLRKLYPENRSDVFGATWRPDTRFAAKEPSPPSKAKAKRGASAHEVTDR